MLDWLAYGISWFFAIYIIIRMVQEIDREQPLQVEPQGPVVDPAPDAFPLHYCSPYIGGEVESE